MDDYYKLPEPLLRQLGHLANLSHGVQGYESSLSAVQTEIVDGDAAAARRESADSDGQSASTQAGAGAATEESLSSTAGAGAATTGDDAASITESSMSVVGAAASQVPLSQNVASALARGARIPESAFHESQTEQVGRAASWTLNVLDTLPIFICATNQSGIIHYCKMSNINARTHFTFFEC